MEMKKWSIFFLAAAVSGLINGCSSKDTTIARQPGGDINIIKDIQYGSAKNWLGETESLALDIYQPANMQPGKKYPLVLQMHGGGFVTGDKNTAVQKCTILADSGFIAATINYRIGWNTGVDTCDGDLNSFADAYYRGIQDANAALRFLVANADKYNIDPSWIFISGASAGADIGLGVLYVDDNYVNAHFADQKTRLGDLNTADNNITASFTIKGIHAIAGGIFDSTLINANKAYPCISFQGEDDNVVPVNSGTYLNCANYPMEYGSLCQYRQLVAYHKPAVAHILPGAGHGNNGDSGYDSPFMMSNTACFFHNLINGTANSQTGIYTGVVYSCPD